MSHLRFPRQSNSTSASSDNATSASPSSLVITTDSSTPTTTAQSSTPATTSAEPTTASSSPETTSSPQNASPPQTSNNAPTSSSDERTSDSSSSSSSVFSSRPPSATTQPPTSSSPSPPETLTTITSSYTAYLSGTPIVTTTTIPSTIPQASSSTPSDRSAIIAGSAAGGTAVIILLLSLAFFARRKRFKRLHFLDTIMLKRKRARSRATLLDGDDTPETDLEQSPRIYTDLETPWDGKNVRDGTERALMVAESSGAAAPAVAPHWSETGSAFREDFWPPPGEASRLMDSLANRDDVDLSQIVDDVMGPSVAAVHFSDQSISSVHRGSMHDSEGFAHSRTVSNASRAALLEAAGLAGLLSTAPVHSSPLAQPKERSGEDAS